MTETATHLNDLPQTQRKRRGHSMWPPKADAKKIPALYSTEDVPLDEKIVHLHYFAANADWFIVEVDPATGMAFGYAEIGMGGGEFGSIYLPELEKVNVYGGLVIVERDRWFDPKPFKELRLR